MAFSAKRNNYTAVLERVYGISEGRIIHIHGSLRDHECDPVLGHGNIERIEQIDEIYVIPSYRSKGVGKELFKLMENEIKESCDYITLSTSTKDYKKILHFYVDELDMNFHSAFLIKDL